MHIDTYRQAWLTLQRCGYQKERSYGTPMPGKVVLIGKYGDQVCAKVQYGAYSSDSEWFCYDGGGVTKMTSPPRGTVSGVIPPGCSL